jgi:hypothetical protein
MVDPTPTPRAQGVVYLVDSDLGVSGQQCRRDGHAVDERAGRVVDGAARPPDGDLEAGGQPWHAECGGEVDGCAVRRADDRTRRARSAVPRGDVPGDLLRIDVVSPVDRDGLPAPGAGLGPAAYARRCGPVLADRWCRGQLAAVPAGERERRGMQEDRAEPVRIYRAFVWQAVDVHARSVQDGHRLPDSGEEAAGWSVPVAVRACSSAEGRSWPLGGAGFSIGKKKPRMAGPSAPRRFIFLGTAAPA